MGPGRALFSSCRKGFTAFRPRLFHRPWTKHGQSGANELRAASEPCCAGTGNGASGSAVVGLDPDAGLITTAVDLLGANHDLYKRASRLQTRKSPASDEQLSDP
jgi:hypothetical protein